MNKLENDSNEDKVGDLILKRYQGSDQTIIN